jgi:ribosomal-protein-alanine N-acetyltransferase
MTAPPWQVADGELDPATAEAVAALLTRSFETPEEQWSAEAVRASSAAATRLVVHGSGGAAILRITADEAELLAIAVDPAARRRGLGRSLLAAAETAAHTAGARRIVLEVAEGNAAAAALYAAAGYAAIGRRRDYYRRADGRREDALLMARDLASPPSPAA